MGAGKEANNPTLLWAGSTLAKCSVFNFYFICKDKESLLFVTPTGELYTLSI